VGVLTDAEAATAEVLALELEAVLETVAAGWALPELEEAGLAGAVWAAEADAGGGVVSGTAAVLGRFTLMTVEDGCVAVFAGTLALLPELLVLVTLLAEPPLTEPLVLETLLEVPLVLETPLLEVLLPETPLPEPLLPRAELSLLSVVTTIPVPWASPTFG
jgi:hypothetical protein